MAMPCCSAMRSCGRSPGRGLFTTASSDFPARRSLRLVHNIEDAVMRPIRRGTGALNLLADYVGALIDDPMIAIPEMRRLIFAQLCDLVAVTLDATRDAAAVAEGRGIRAARLRAIKSDIELHLAHEDLSPAAVARRQRISDSYIRKLFEGEGTSFSEFVLLRRLVRAHRMLTDRRWADPKHCLDCIRVRLWRPVLFQSHVQASSTGQPPSEIRGAIDRRSI